MTFQENIPHLWTIDLEKHNDKLDAYTSLLSSQELKKADSFKFSIHRSNYIVARSALKSISAKYLGQDAESIKLACTSFGKPYFDFETKLQFNLSHSGTKAVLGLIYGQKIGVDLEFTDNGLNILEIGRTVFSQEEMAILETEESKDLQLKKFYHFWTRKEAFIKALGYGFSMPIDLKLISVVSEKVKVLGRDIPKDMEINEPWFLKSLETWEDYAMAVSLKTKIESVSFETWEGL